MFSVAATFGVPAAPEQITQKSLDNVDALCVKRALAHRRLGNAKKRNPAYEKTN
jgi:hypothetical protein